MKAVITTIAVILVIIVGYLLIKGTDAKSPDYGSTASSTADATGDSNTDTGGASNDTTPSIDTYTNATNGISFSYPRSFVVENKLSAQDAWRNNATSSGTLMVTVTTPASYVKGTNFADAKLGAGFSADASEVDSCTSASSFETKTGTQVINGVTFSKFTTSDAAAGNRYDTTSYRTVHGGKCYAVEYTIHYGNIQNYDPNQGIKEFDESAVKKAFDDIVSSFKFTK
jgi:hypothetical protein